MYSKGVNYLTALILLGVLAAVYQFTWVVWLQPPEIPFAPLRHVARSVEDREILQFFPDDSWQHDARKRMTFKDQGYVLFGERKQVNVSQWRVWPVTFVMQRDSQQAIILEANEGADIAFAEPLDMMSNKTPPIKSAQLIGQVRIHSHELTDSAAADPLQMVTRDVGVDSRRIWTNEAVRLEWGGLLLEGRNLTLRLAAGGVIPTSSGVSPLSMLDNLELVYLDRLEIPVPAIEKGGLAADSSLPDGRATLQCNGRITYDFAMNVLRLRDEVRMQHHPHAGETDSIQCDAITLELNSPLMRELPREGPRDWIRRIEALGRPVVAKMPSLGAEVVAEEIRLQPNEGRLQVQGSAGIRLAYQGMNFRTTDLVYQFSPSNPTELGRMDCAGSGLLDLREAHQGVVHTIQWKKGLRLSPADQENEHDLLVSGTVVAGLEQGGKLTAETVHFRFRQQTEVASSPDTTPTSPPHRVREPQAAAALLQPITAVASGGVVFDSHLAYAETNRLQLFFAAPPADHDTQGEEPGIMLGPATGTKDRFWVRQPDGEAISNNPVSRPRPRLSANQVHAHLTVVGQQILRSDMTLEGQVRMQHQLPTQQAVLPLVLQGEKLRVVSTGSDDTVQIEGGREPARFLLGDGHFIGPLILLSTRDNYLWMNQAGEFQVPTALLPTGDTEAAIQWASAPHCSWQGSMGFDGQTIELQGDVRMHAKLSMGTDPSPWVVRASGQSLRMDLDRPVTLRNPDEIRAAAIREIALLEADQKFVFFTAEQFDGNDRQLARHVLATPRISLQPNSGQLVAPGPGWYRQWSAETASGPFGGVLPEDSLLATHLVFQERMQGDLANKSLGFHVGVRIGVQPVQDWDTSFDAQHMETLELGHATVETHQLRLTQAPQPAVSSRQASIGLTGNRTRLALPGNNPPAWEVEASEGVRFRARNERGLFEAMGNRAAYASLKDLFVIQGDGRAPATFRQTQPSGAPGMQIALGYLKIRPQTMEVDSELLMANPGTLPNQQRTRN